MAREKINLHQITDDSTEVVRIAIPNNDTNTEKDRLDEKEHGEENKEKKLTEIPEDNKKSLVLKTFMFAMTIAVTCGSAIWYLNSSDILTNLLGQDAAKQQDLTQSTYMTVTLEINALKEQLTRLATAADEVNDLRAQHELMKKQIENIRTELSRETNLFFEQSKLREEQLTEIRAELLAIQKGKETTIEKILELQKNLIRIETEQTNQATKLAEKYEMLSKVENTERHKTATNKSKNQSTHKTDDVEPVVTNKLGYLELDSIATFGNQNIAIFSDGLSGAIQLTEGDVIGSFRITKITLEEVFVVDTIGNQYVVTNNG